MISSTIPLSSVMHQAVRERDGHARPKASRAVGTANGPSPLTILVPCHRVICADGNLSGYGGGLWRKQKLLDHEREVWAAKAARA